MEKILNGDFLRAQEHFLFEDKNCDVRGLAKVSFGNEERNIENDTTDSHDGEDGANEGQGEVSHRRAILATNVGQCERVFHLPDRRPEDSPTQPQIAFVFYVIAFSLTSSSTSASCCV